MLRTASLFSALALATAALAAPAAACTGCGCSAVENTAGVAAQKSEVVAHAHGEGHTHAHQHSHGDSHGKAAGVAPGQAAPAFELMDQNGDPVTLDDFAGRIVVLEFFNDQCPFVKKFYRNGDMNRMVEDLTADGDVAWLAIDSSGFSNVQQNQEIAEAWNMGDRSLLDDARGEVGRMYGAKTTPHMFVIDADGDVAYMGAIDDRPSTDSGDIADANNYVVQAVEALKSGTAVSTPQTQPYGCSVKYAN